MRFFVRTKKNDTSNQISQRCVSLAPKFPPFLALVQIAAGLLCELPSRNSTRKFVCYVMLWYGNFIYTRYFLLVHLHLSIEKLTSLTNLKSKTKTKIIKMKRKHLLFKEALCKNNILLIKLIVHRKLSLNFPLNKLVDVNCRTSRGKLFQNTLPLY